MAFSSKQVAALRRNVDQRHIRIRQSSGRELSYLEGWYVISQANRIFGFDGWSRETLESKCVLARENRGYFTAVYTAKVRLTVQANGIAIIREGHGTGEGRGESPGEVHDTALKAAETDATKRALITFGRPFGLELYRSDSSVGHAGRSAARQANEGASSLPSHQITSSQPAYVPPEQVPSVAATATLPPSKGNGSADPETPVPLQPARPEPPRFQNAKPHPDDGTPIPRPSTHFGLKTYLATREERGALIEAAGREALKAEQQTSAASDAARLRQVGHSDPRAPARIDKSALALPEPRRLRDKNHLKYVASQACLICGRQPADPHHLRFAQPRAIGMKVSGEFTVPLCRSHHRNLHQAGNELRWWANFRIEPLPIARKLWEDTHPNALRHPTTDIQRPHETAAVTPVSDGAENYETNPINQQTGLARRSS